LAEGPKKPLIPGRVMLIGEEGIPREIIDGLQDQHIEIFTREPDPAKWPSEMAHLVHYLPREERLRIGLFNMFEKHRDILEGAIQAWVRSVWTDLRDETSALDSDREAVIEEMVKYLRESILQLLEDVR